MPARWGLPPSSPVAFAPHIHRTEDQDQRLRPWARSGVTSCRSVRSSPITGVGPRPTASGSACVPARAARFSPRAAVRAAPASQPDSGAASGTSDAPTH